MSPRARRDTVEMRTIYCSVRNRNPIPLLPGPRLFTVETELPGIHLILRQSQYKVVPFFDTNPTADVTFTIIYMRRTSRGTVSLFSARVVQEMVDLLVSTPEHIDE